MAGLTLFSGPYYLAEQLGYRKLVDTTFMIASMVTGDPETEDLKKFFRRLKRAQRDIDLRPDLYTHYYRTSSDALSRHHGHPPWGPGSVSFRAVHAGGFLAVPRWIAERGIFGRGRPEMGSDSYADAVMRCLIADTGPGPDNRTPRVVPRRAGLRRTLHGVLGGKRVSGRGISGRMTARQVAELPVFVDHSSRTGADSMRIVVRIGRMPCLCLHRLVDILWLAQRAIGDGANGEAPFSVVTAT